jgi:hypothetical protein
MKMINTQVSMFNEWSMYKCINTRNHCFIANSLSIEHCPLSVAADHGEVALWM